MLCAVFAFVMSRWPVGAPRPQGLLLTTFGPLAAILTVFVLLVVFLPRITGKPLTESLQSVGARIAWGIVIAAVMLGANVAFRPAGSSALAAGAKQFPMALMFVGMGFAMAAFGRRGPEPRCAVCGYDLTGAPVPWSQDDRCPECGGLFRRTGGTVQGQRRVHRGLLAFGALILVGQFGLLIYSVASPLTGGNRFISLLPTGSLILEVTRQGTGFTRDQWAELNTRTLTPGDEARLARGLIELRACNHYMDPAAEAWLDAHAKSGGMSHDLLERLCAEWLDIWLVAPARGRVGEPLVLGLAGDYRGGFGRGGGAALVARIVFDGFRIGDDPALQSRAATSIHGLRLMPEELWTQRSRGSLGSRPQALGDRSPQLIVTPHAPGALRIRATVWIIINPQAGGLNPVFWNDDGTPELPADAVWTRRVELEHTIDVDP